MHDSTLSNPEKVGTGMIIQDNNGDWIAGAYKHIPCSVALRHSLMLVRDNNVSHIIVEFDAYSVTSLIRFHKLSSPLLYTLIYDCRTFLDGFHQYQLKHKFKEGGGE
ncbi:hypothetical protein PVK06_021339 [Gossypium arboreum]|uniref:RNase H type-1 domain-containing protein n=1 Tax=Gossypium arboreum TaxID=29729 RepID=A0ABR0PQ89_GOSAR|nr:hypothetical protein PVK06_021339 [Gossypium arboreum]